ncbi:MULTISPECIES: hypothetical protein [Thermotoga]|uniref:Uncharacterized protein n=1 Tax=Thermotoga neapolitana (strain ATCC 49049 / DSM 4359 / NBRC 107923 / NS-E) TaxID=309803 RepID=B9K807_THENN|nr:MULTISPECIES: hypothetical protein [Thermotoga]ACM23090.1 Putative uncharacterized protein [Thermotoga neapolitana DSM 4359]AJG41005.1 hypothetical protein TRQ7_06005 [Thermotoga sp. RQ7]KFZ21899.1 hypothetical protein LA10_04733 [Thermotoga neapolitana LA10]HBF11629.1 hypothetical protein [Thermotoga neapolitana]
MERSVEEIVKTLVEREKRFKEQLRKLEEEMESEYKIELEKLKVLEEQRKKTINMRYGEVIENAKMEIKRLEAKIERERVEMKERMEKIRNQIDELVTEILNTLLPEE